MSTKKVSAKKSHKAKTESTVSESMIAEAAYYKAERRGFSDGQDIEDWIEAEQELKAELEFEASDS